MIVRYIVQRLPVLLLLAALLATVAQAQSTEGNTVFARQAGKPTYVERPASDLKCRPFGECEPCPEDDLKQPFCMPFGNRRLLHCVPAAYKGSEKEPPGEVPAWEACGKVVKKEERDYYEFITANVLFLVVCLAIYGVRTSALATQQYRQLAARIGIPSGAWRV